METVKLLLQLYFRPASAMSEIIDKGSWPFAAASVLLISFAFFATVNLKLQETYRIPAFYEFYSPVYDSGEESEAEIKAQYDKAYKEYDDAMKTRRKIPLVGDTFFKFFSFEPDKFYQPLLSISIFYVPAAILLMSLFGGRGETLDE